MTTASRVDVTRLLQAWGKGEKAALQKLIPLVYKDLRRRAHYCMGRERAGHTLQTTALIHEAYLRLAGSKPVSWQNRAHFFAIAARLMRQVLVDQARSRRYLKRGGGAKPVTLDEVLLVAPGPRPDLVSLDEALTALAQCDERKARVVELRFFGGLTVEEAAEALKVSPETVKRDWRLAKAWLFREMGRKGPEARDDRGAAG